MPSFLTRSPRRAAYSPSAPPEEDEQPAEPQPNAPSPVGTTGGLIPQQAGTWNRPVVPLSDDPTQRRQQHIVNAEAAFADKQRADNPFIFSNDIKSLASVGGRQAIEGAVRSGEQAYQQQQRVAQQQAAGETADFNSKALAQFKARGQQYYTDPASGRLTPVVDESGRALYHETPWESTTHPKTGMPVMGKRDRFGQQQFKELPIVPGEDPTDERMYYKTPEGETVDAGAISDLMQHPNYNVRKQALAANTRRSKAMVQRTLQPLKELSDVAANEYQEAQNERDGLASQIQQANTAAEENADNQAQADGYRATAAQMQSRLDALNQSLGPKGQLGTRRAEAGRNYNIALRQSVLGVYQAQAQEMEHRLRAEGKDPATDPAYRANQEVLGKIQQDLAPQQPQAPGAAPEKVPLLESSEPYALAQRGEKGIGGVPLQQLAQRFGSGQGEVKPDSLLAIRQRIDEIDQTLNARQTPETDFQNAVNSSGMPQATTQISGKLRTSLQQQRDYLDSLFTQRMARLPEEGQKSVNDALEKLKPTSAGGAFARSAGTGVAPAAGALAGFNIGSKLGMPLAGSTRGIAPLVTGTIGAFLGGVLANKAQKAALDRVAPDTAKELERLQALDAEGHPLAEAAGQLASSLPVFKVNPLMAARGLAAVVKIARGDAVNATEKAAAKILALQSGVAAAQGVANPLMEGRKPGVSDVTQAVAQAMLFGEGRFGGHEAAPKQAAPEAAVVPEAVPAKTPAQAAQEIAAPRVERSAEDVAGIFERNPSQTNEPAPPISNARESAAAILEGQARQEAQAAAEAQRTGAPRLGPAEGGQSPEQVARQEALTGGVDLQEPASGAGSAPNPGSGVETVPVPASTDRAAYDAIQARMAALGHDKAGTPEYNALWKQSEEIKNRNGGMPPGEVAGGETSTQQGEPNALPIESPGSVLQHPQEGTGEAGSERQRVEPSQQGPEAARAKEAAKPETVQQGVENAPAKKPQPPAPEPVAERPATTELKKNNAGEGLKPVSALSRAEKRAELDAAGIKEYKGKKLDDLNPAELSNAVGKARRGELTPEGDKSALDRTISRLDEEIKKYSGTGEKPGDKGRMSSEKGSSDLHTAAYVGALKVARGVLAAGRTVAEAVAAALKRYRAMHPEHTADDLATAETDLTKAIEPSLAGKAKAVVKKATDALEMRDQLSARRDAGDNLAGLHATEVRTEISDALDRIAPESPTEKATRALNVPGRARTARDTADAALRFYIEANDGDKSKLAEMRAKIEGSTKASPKWKKQALEAIDYALENGDKLKDAANRTRLATGNLLTAETEAGLPVVERKNYVPRYQDVNERGFLEPGGSGGSAGNRKNRTFETTADSIAAGIDPKSLSTVDSLTNRVNAGLKAVGEKKFRDALHETKTAGGDALAVKPEKVERADGTSYNEAPKGYALMSLGGEQVAVKENYKPLIEALTEQSWFTKHSAGLATMKTAALAKSLTLVLDTFHLGRVAMAASALNASHPEGFKLGPRYKEGKMLYEHSPEEIVRMGQAGDIPKASVPELLKNKKILTNLTSNGYNTGQVADALHQGFIHDLPVLGGINKFIFQSFQRGAMADAGIMEFKRQKADNPDMTDAQVARKVAKELNTKFGAIGRQGWFKSATGRDLARLIALAPQWNEGLIKSEVGGATQLAKGAANLAQGKAANVGALGRGLASMALGTFVASQIINQATRGKFTWENPEEGWESKVSAWIPDKVGGSSGFFLNPVGLTAETSHLLAKNYERADGGPVAKARQALVDYGRSRESALAKPADTLLTGKDYLNRNIKPDDVVKEAAKAAVPFPISGGSAMRVAKGLATGGKTEAFPGEFQKQAMQSAGIRTDLAPSPEARIQNLAHEFRKAHGSKDSGSHDIPEYGDLTAALRRGNDDDVKSSIADLLKTHPADDLEKYYRTWSSRPYAGSHKLEADFLRSLNQEQRQQYVKARAERKRIGELAARAIRQIPAAERAGPYAKK